ncbi:hypothetical protein [Bradyrhizobium sp. LVM 105]|nr:hypothetical protein [Bradyrhizobium sp. LVM 105]
MTAILLWTGVALWLAFNAAIAARSLHVARPVKAKTPARVIQLHRRRD